MIWHAVVENSLNWEAEDRGFISESATYYMYVLGQAM